ncbi:16S rRNA (guanine(966)-N(2))-methyltransferase RsmD [Asticcacaulis sp. BYS171W]|uniref:16S rRNA (Guanine(966)-N(2))-methyltransferase RsmD n=1 Tax=Asticcacaulis aquaticus TaxID=2984212 RepID=A0ABT5HV09_9CAUL|nr:16S rRNA (guanine(966)-N(2))-methyltransferase RsmD [Asticcacaulis aquaticus]MDC7683905.1 16S rRNA (guanine(966)-N(2))-methyltransferase RsmD [Asticcacaulis aquaticus]
MRVVGGDFRGRALTTPDGQNTRPTSDRARQAIFNILEHADFAPNLSGARIMDVFAGSGALGIEAMSRGAAFCLFVDTDDAARGAIRENVEAFGLFGNTRIHRRDATQLGIRPGNAAEAFDLVFMDPPYRKGLGPMALEALHMGKWLADDALIMLEVAADEDFFATDLWQIIDTRLYGQAQVIFLKQKIFTEF